MHQPSTSIPLSNRPPTFHRAQFWTALWGLLMTLGIGTQLVISTSLYEWEVPGAGRFHSNPGLNTVVTIEGQEIRMTEARRRINWQQAPLFVAGLVATVFGAAGAPLLIARRKHFDRLTDKRRFHIVILAWLTVPAIALLSLIYNVSYLSGT
jgi:hypothetical protein